MYADNKYHNYDLYEWLDQHAGYRLHIVRRPEDTHESSPRTTEFKCKVRHVVGSD